ncbi:hypothetical protein VNO77_32470 [Canavalia gladiata]|uniref:ZCF37 n=1 Tax=Canavalia gladiata TaxID=3824 RepID=A0AAN9KUC0_CANGL
MHTLNPFVCGTFHNEDDEPCLASPGSSPRKYKRKNSRNNNPYSTRGLDKFSELLADLDEKRQKIYSQMNPHDISFVRFVYSNTDDFVPVVVKVKNNKDQKHNKNQELRVVKARALTHNTSESTDKSVTTDQFPAEERKKPSKREITDHKKSFSWNNYMKSWDMKKPSFYLPVVIIFILLLLTVFGKSVATICTCILWYVISTLKDGSSNPRKSMKKKDYVRGLSEKKVVANELGTKKKDYVRGWSENKMVVTEGTKNNKKDYVRGWSEKMATEGLLSPRSGDSEVNSTKKIRGQHSHKKSW